MFKLKQKDMLLLAYLRQNSRMRLTALSQRTGVPVSTIFDKIKTATPFVSKYTVMMNFQPLGFATRAMVVLKIKKGNRQEVSEYLQRSTSVNTAFKINNGCDYIIDTVFRDMKELEDFLEHLESTFKVEKQQVYYILDVLKQEDFLSSPQVVQRFFPSE